MIKAAVYLHASRESMWEKGEELGLSGEALKMFSFACTEVRVDLSVDEGTGEARIVAVDGRAVAS